MHRDSRGYTPDMKRKYRSGLRVGDVVTLGLSEVVGGREGREVVPHREYRVADLSTARDSRRPLLMVENTDDAEKYPAGGTGEMILGEWSTRVPCWYHATDGCRVGDTCNYSHAGDRYSFQKQLWFAGMQPPKRHPRGDGAWVVWFSSQRDTPEVSLAFTQGLARDPAIRAVNEACAAASSPLFQC